MTSLHAQLEAAVAFQRAGDAAAAAERYAAILTARPDHPDATHLLGLAERDLGRPLAALERLRRAVALAPEAAAVHANLGTTCLMTARHDEAVRHLERAAALAPAVPGFFSNRLMVEHYRPGVTLEALDVLHRRWDARYAAPVRRLPAAGRPFDLEPAPDRPLRIGFVSPDLGVHPVGIFLVGLLEHLERPALHATCYALRDAGDELAARLAAASDAWVDARALDEPRLAARIRADRIDVLFDLCGHTQANRLRTFALRPAPVQGTWMGYVGTTGLAEMDLLVADPFQVPDDAAAAAAIRERVVRLPGDYVILDPPAGVADVEPPPMLERGHVTFGSFNNPSKLNDPLLDAWARVLLAVPGSRLRLKYKGFDDPGLAAEVRSAFAARGVDGDRVDCEGRSPRVEHLGCYGGVDVCLDTHPYSGGLTTLEALWMGVPVVTLPGRTFASRHSLTHLHAAGEPETVAADWDDYVAIAAKLAGDPEALAAARATRRDRLAASPAGDARAYARNVAAMVREAWGRWCADGTGDRHPAGDHVS